MVKWCRWLWLVGVVLLAACGVETANQDATATAGLQATGQVSSITVPTVTPATALPTSTPLIVTVPTSATGQTAMDATTVVPAAMPTATGTSAATVVPVAATAAASEAPAAAVSEGPTGAAATAAPAAGGGGPASAWPGRFVLRRDADLYLYRPRSGELKLLAKNGDVARFSADGKQLAWVVADVLYSGGSEGDQPRNLGSHPGINALAWAPDGSRLLFERTTDDGKTGEIWVVELASGHAQKIADGSDAAWAPDSKRIAYVTLPGDEPIRKTQLRLINYKGENGWAAVTAVPANAPPLGPPQSKRDPKQFEHVLSSPVWEQSGKAIYLVSLIGSQVETDYGMWERADSANGGSTFVNELVNVFSVVPAPDHSMALLVHSTARGDTYFSPQATTGDASAYGWAKTDAGFRDDAPAWAPDGQAIAYYHCQLEPPGPCDLVVRSPRGSSTLIPHVITPDAGGTLPAPVLDWAPDS